MFKRRLRVNHRRSRMNADICSGTQASCGDVEMKSIARLFAARRETNSVTLAARQRLANTMPGEVGAMNSLRLTGCGL